MCSALIKVGVPLRRIARETGYSRKVVRGVVRGERSDVLRTRESSLELYLSWLNGPVGQRREERHGAMAQAEGRPGLPLIPAGHRRMGTCRRRSEKASVETLTRVPSAYTIARLMTIGRDNLTKAETIIVAAVEEGIPAIVEAREMIADFHAMIRRKDAADLSTWIARALQSLVATFGRGVVKDEEAVRAAIVLPWSKGQTEGQITKLKLVKRQMYGRGKIDLLQARLIGASPY